MKSISRVVRIGVLFLICYFISPLVGDTICKVSYHNYPEQLHNKSIEVPSNTVALSEKVYIKKPVVSDTTTDTSSATIVFVIDNSGSMFQYDDSIPPADKDGHRFLVTCEILDSLFLKDPNTEVGAVIFKYGGYYDIRVDPNLFKPSALGRSYIPPLKLSKMYSTTLQSTPMRGYDILKKYLETRRRWSPGTDDQGNRYIINDLVIPPLTAAFAGSDITGAFVMAKEAFSWSNNPINKQHIIFFSDGVTQSGLGSVRYPLGYGDEVEQFIKDQIINNYNISAKDLAKRITEKANLNDNKISKDDISCVVIYFRRPRKAMLVTGPPVCATRDSALAEKVKSFIGERIICGGTTSNILAREWDLDISVPLKNIDPSMPPMGKMKEIDLISEGIITLGRVSEFLESGIPEDCHPKNPAMLIVNSLLDRDKITFLIGTKINDAHQDPNMPVELEIRRNVIKKISRLLKDKFLKETEIEFI